MKLQANNKYGFPLNLQGCEAIKVIFQYENGEMLEKNKIDIVDIEKGQFKVELSDFEIQGLKVGEKQNIYAKIYFQDMTYHVMFPKGLTVGIKDERKVLL